MKNKKLTIRKINHTGKWTEFWFEEEKNSRISDDPEYSKYNIEDHWVHCCKTYMFYDMIDNNGLSDHLHNHGAAGLKTEWEYISPNWTLISIKK